MSYEVYIDVRHHPRHLEEWEQKVSSCARLPEPKGATPTDAERMRAVVGVLRNMADEYDPDVRCTNCGEVRADHDGYPDNLVRCFNRYGPTTLAAWWEPTVPD